MPLEICCWSKRIVGCARSYPFICFIALIRFIAHYSSASSVGNAALSHFRFPFLVPPIFRLQISPNHRARAETQRFGRPGDDAPIHEPQIGQIRFALQNQIAQRLRVQTSQRDAVPDAADDN